MSRSQSRFIIYNKNTIFEPAYSETQPSRPRKRARIEEDEDEAFTGIVRDTEYYDWDKSEDTCVILVCKTLFRVKMKALSKISITLRNLISGTHTSDENPVSLDNCDAEQFRALLWALNASPEQLKIREIPRLERFCSLARFSHSYACPSQKTLALSAIRDFVTIDESLFGTCSSPTLHLLAETAIKCEDSILLDIIVTKWIQRIQRLEAPCVPAIITADDLHIIRLSGAACYVHLQEVAEHSTTVSEKGATRFHMDPKLDVAQKARLLGGFWSLVRYWEWFRRYPAKMLSCSHADCAKIWERCWNTSRDSRQILCTSQADVLGLMRIMRELLKADVDLLGMAEKCRGQSLEALSKAREELNGNLGDHFADLL